MGQGETIRRGEKPDLHPSWWLPIGGIAFFVVSMGVMWRSIPEPMAVQWSTDGEITNTMPKLGWAALWSAVWVLVSGGLGTLRAPFDWRRGLLILVLGILIVVCVITIASNRGAETWREADSLNLLSAAMWVVVAAGAVWAVDRLLGRWSDGG